MLSKHIQHPSLHFKLQTMNTRIWFIITALLLLSGTLYYYYITLSEFTFSNNNLTCNISPKALTDALYPSTPHTNINQTEFPKICIGVRTYNGHKWKLAAMLFSLLATEYPNLDVTLIDTGNDPFVEMQKTIDTFNILVGAERFHNLNINPVEARKLANVIFPMDDYGYVQTDFYLRGLYENNTQGCEYVMITNGDNLYAHDYFASMKDHLIERYDLLGTEFISHHCLQGSNGLIHKGYQCDAQVLAKFQVNWIDLGAITMRVGYLKQRPKKYFVTRDGGAVELSIAYAADGFLVASLAGGTTKKYIVERTLFFHQ